MDGDRCAALGLSNSVAFCPGDFEIVDHGDAETGAVIQLHELLDVEWQRWFGVAERNGRNAVFHAVDAGGGVGIWLGLSRRGDSQREKKERKRHEACGSELHGFSVET